MQLLRKISARTVFGSKADIQTLVLVERNTRQPLFRVVGIANGMRTGSTEDVKDENAGPDVKSKPRTIDAATGKPMRDWTALLGGFEAQKLDKDGTPTGEKFRSGVCFLPNYVVDSVTGQLTSDVLSVKFAFDIYAMFDEQSATSYTYEAVSLIEPAEDDQLALLSKQLATPKIAAPTETPKDQPKEAKKK